MSRNDGFRVLALAVAGGFLGGVVGRWWPPPVAFAQAAATPPAQVVRAERFEVVDKDGKRRGRFDALPNGTVRLLLYDTEGKIRTGLLVAANGAPGLQFWGPNDQVAAVYADSVTLLDPDGQPRARLAPAPSLTLYNADGRPSWSAP